jgi:hypothetical protein
MDTLRKDDAFMMRATDDVEDLIGNLPPELRSAFGGTKAAQVQLLLESGIEDIVARMMAGEGEKAS